jgi:uncharacterized protein (TIGR03437 family)
MQLPNFHSFKLSFHHFALLPAAVLISLLSLAAFVFTPGTRAATTIQNSTPVVGVSAASYSGGAAPLAPNSIIAAFGTQLSRATEAATSQPLPTTLSGVTVKITDSAGTERLAPLFFVSAYQINFLIPEGTANGEAQVTIISLLTNGDQVISRGRLRISANAPALFAANSSGSGAPAAFTGRITNGNFVFDPNPPYEADPANPGQLQPRPIDVGTEAQPAYLILYGTGWRNAPAGSVRVLIGGVEVTPDYAGIAPGYTGLDQINARIPTSLRGRGRVDFSIVANGISSNLLTVHAAGSAGGNLSISGFSIADGAVAGQTLMINGSGFATTASQNLVRFGNAQGRVISASATQMQVIIPFGAESGRVMVQTPQGEIRSNAAFRVRTSVSGIVQTTGTSSSAPVPMEGVTVRLVGDNVSVRTNRQGSFILPNVQPGPKLIEVDGATNNSAPPYPRVILKMNVQSDRDNQFTQPISMQQITGPGVDVGYTGGAAENPDKRLRPGVNPFFVNITDRNVTLDLPTGTQIRFPDGKMLGRVNLTVLEKSRLPGLRLPPGVYSSTIVQITPIGTRFEPGAILSFPNPDPANLNAGAKVDFYRYDEASGAFIKRGTGTISQDKSRVVSDGRIVDQASYWFAAAQSGVTTVTGRVIDSLGLPVSGAHVTVNGRADTTDENGGFIISDVATAGLTQLQAEAVLPQQFGTPPRGTSSVTAVKVNGITSVGTIALSNTNQPGLVLSPFAIRFASTAPPITLSITLTQPAPAGGLQISLASDNTAVATVPASVTIPAGQTTTTFNVTRTGPGYAILSALATLNSNALDSYAYVEVARPAPVLSGVSPATAPIFGRVTISGTGFSTDPGNNFVGLIRNGQLVAIFEPDDNELIQDQSGHLALSVKVPPVSNGAGQLVAAVVDDQTDVLSDVSAPLNFNVLTNSVSAPVLASLSPVSGKPKDQITINGSGFSANPDENQVVFRQNGIDAHAQILQASASQLVVRVPSVRIDKGTSTVFAIRFGTDGSASEPSNALDFNVTEGPIAPRTPVLASVVNAQTQTASGRDGDLIIPTGTNFGTNYFNLETGELANSDPVITLLGFYQNGQLLGIQFPQGAVGGTQLTATFPTGLSEGTAQITSLNIDFESGLISSESAPVNFTVTAGSLRVIDEDEPNDGPDTATAVPLQSLVTGQAGSTDPGGFTITFTNGTTEKVHDLFRLSLARTTDLQLSLFFETGDLDLFLIKGRPNSDGTYTVLSFSADRSGAPEYLASQALAAGDYLIGVASVGSLTSYVLQISEGIPAHAEKAAPQNESGLQAVKGEAVKSEAMREMRREVTTTRRRFLKPVY